MLSGTGRVGRTSGPAAAGTAGHAAAVEKRRAAKNGANLPCMQKPPEWTFPSKRLHWLGRFEMANFYCCDRCPSYCCSYPRIPVQDSDIRRLALHLGLAPEIVARKFTKKSEEPGEVILRHQP